MDKTTATELMKRVIDLDPPLNAAAGVIEGIADEEERKQFRRAIAEIAGRVYIDLIMPIEKQYPDLNPDKK